MLATDRTFIAFGAIRLYYTHIHILPVQFCRASDAYYCEDTQYEAEYLPIAVKDISCGMADLYIHDCGKGSGCGHEHDVCLVCESKYTQIWV